MWSRRCALVLGAFSVVLGLVSSSAGAAQGEQILGYHVAMVVQPDGSVAVTETIDYDFGANRKRGIFRDIPVRLHYDETYDRLYPIHDIAVSGNPGTPTAIKVTSEGSTRRIRVGDPDVRITGVHRYVISYRVDGAIDRYPDHDELFWNAIGQEWAVPVAAPSVSVTSASGITNVGCFSGPYGSRQPCDRAVFSGTSASFGNADLAPGGALSVVVALPAGAVARPGPVLDERITVANAFELTPTTGPLTALVLLVGGAALGWLLWAKGRDRRYAGVLPGLNPAAGDGPQTRVPLFDASATTVEFLPPDKLRPAQVGVLIDESADTLDVSATIVDLAVRGYLRITEHERKHFWTARDWTLTQLKGADSALLPYERTLYDALFETGTDVMLSALRTKFHTDLAKVRKALYEDCVKQGWFVRRPDSVRGRWLALGIALVVLGVGVTVVLVPRQFGLVGLAFVVVGIAFLVGSRWFPSRTGRGSAMLVRLLGFRRYIATAEAGQLRFEEGEDIFSRYLPYAIVFGETKRWAKAFADLGASPTTSAATFGAWYSTPYGNAGFAGIGESMTSFVGRTSSVIAATPGGSGGGGGGFSGGGGGGGGGGSW